MRAVRAVLVGLMTLLSSAGPVLGAEIDRPRPLERNALVLSVNMEQIVRNETQWRTDWGDFSKDCINARVLVIALRQLGTGNPTVRVRWYFIGRDHDAKKLFIYDSGESTGNIANGGVKLAATSRELVETRTQITELSNDSVLRTRSLTGRHPYGWTVIVEQDGRHIGEQSSLPELTEWTQKLILSGE